MDNEFDWACRRLARLAPLPLLTWLLTSFTQHLRFVNWLDTRTASSKEDPQRIRDRVAELQELLQGRPWLLLLEFQGEPDPDMFGRLLIYLGTSWLELRPDTLPGSRYHLAAAVVNLTGTRQSMPASWDMVLPGSADVRCCLQVRERYLQEEAALPLLQAILTGQQGRILLPWIPLMQTEDIDKTIRLWLELWTGETDERMKSEYVGLTRVFIELSKHRNRWQQALEGLDLLKKSAFLQEVRNEEKAQTIVQFLRSKFGVALPADLVQAIEQTRDSVRLNQWVNLAATVVTLDDFRRDSGI